MHEAERPEAANALERGRWNDEAWTLAYTKREGLTDRATPHLLAAAALRPGDAVLDIGSGGGKTALAAAERVGDRGRVVGADISVPLLALATRRAASAGRSGTVTFVHCDVQSEPVGQDHFDVAVSQFGVMFFDEPVVAFTAVAGLLRPGGRLAFACWQDVALNPWFLGPAAAPFVAPGVPLAAGKEPTGPFTMADADRVTGILVAAGFTAVARTAHEVEAELPYDAVADDEALTFMGVGPEAMPDARAAVARQLAPFGAPGGTLRAPIAFHVFIAERPTG